MDSKLIPQEAIEAARGAVAKEMRLRTYDRHAYDDDTFEEGVNDIARATLEAALPFLIREARAAELEAVAEEADMWSMAGAYFPEWEKRADWLRERASATRDGRA